MLWIVSCYKLKVVVHFLKIVKYMKKNLITKPPYNEWIWLVPSDFVKSSFLCIDKNYSSGSKATNLCELLKLVSLVFKQHNYATGSASLQHLNPESFRINIRKFCPTILGCYYWNDIPLSIRNQPTRKLFKKALHQFYFAQYQ